MGIKSSIYVGRRFGKLVVLEDLGLIIKGDNIRRYHYYRCKCDCGNIVDINGSALTGNITKTCGKCFQREAIGKRYGNLVVTSVYTDKGITHCVCKCDCGNDHVDVYAGNLISGKSTSCGMCETYSLVGTRVGHVTILERISATPENGYDDTMFKIKCDCGNVVIKRAQSYGLGATQRITSCGECFNYYGLPDSYKPEVKKMCDEASTRYDDIVARTQNPKNNNFFRYGGRGITLDFDRYTFIKFAYKHPDFKKGCMTDRIDNNKGYSIDNIRFVDQYVNANNTVVQLENTYETIAKRLLTATAFSNALARNKWYRDQFVPISFTEHNFPLRPLWLFIHKSLLDDLDYYVNRIKGFYDKFNGGLTIEDYPDIKLSMKLVELIKDNCKRNSIRIKSFKMFQIVYETVKLDHPEFDDLGNIKFIYDKLLNL